MEVKDNFVILFHPLNNLYSYNFSYLDRKFHEKEFSLLYNELNRKNDNEKEEFLNSRLKILPYIKNEVFEKINSDMDRVGSNMNNATNRFDKYLEKTSYCKLYLIIFAQAAIILYLLL